MHVYGNVSWTDKPEVTRSVDGKDVYVSWNGPQGGDLYVGVSHDFGETWTQQKLTDAERYYYAYDARVLPNGTVMFSESSVVYGAGQRAVDGQVWHHAVISRDRGATWQNVVVDAVRERRDRVSPRGAAHDFYAGQTSVAIDPSGQLAFAYEGADTCGGHSVFTCRRRTTAAGRGARACRCRWPARTRPGRASTSPAPASVRIWYMQTAGGDPDAWNVWFRSSFDGGGDLVVAGQAQRRDLRTGIHRSERVRRDLR